MRPDVIDLYRFYHTNLGTVSQDFVNRGIEKIWPTCRGLRVLGVGYATPYLVPLRNGTERCVALMPASQGVMHWPGHEENLTALGHESAMPFPDALFDRVILAHSLENATYTQQLLREVWRVLAPDGRILVIVPNRHSTWARLEKTPFGHGKPYTANQLTKQLRATMFHPTQWRSALFMPPVDWNVLRKAAPSLEAVGARYLGMMGGVFLVEATKQIYGATPTMEKRKRLIRVLQPALNPTLPQIEVD